MAYKKIINQSFCIGEVLMHFTIKISFDGGLFFNFYFNIIMTCFESTFFIVYVWQ